MTIQELRIAIVALPDDMEVFVNGYEEGLIAPKSIRVICAVEMDEEWQEFHAPMMGTHSIAAGRYPRDGVSNALPFDALFIERHD